MDYLLPIVRLAGIGGLLGKLLACYEGTTQDDALGEIGEPELPRKGVAARTQTPADRSLDDKSKCAPQRRMILLPAINLIVQKKVVENSLQAGELSSFEPREHV